MATGAALVRHAPSRAENCLLFCMAQWHSVTAAFTQAQLLIIVTVATGQLASAAALVIATATGMVPRRSACECSVIPQWGSAPVPRAAHRGSESSAKNVSSPTPNASARRCRCLSTPSAVLCAERRSQERRANTHVTNRRRRASFVDRGAYPGRKLMALKWISRFKGFVQVCWMSYIRCFIMFVFPWRV